MISSYTLLGYPHYRFVGKKLYRLGHKDKRGRFFAMHEIKKVNNNGSFGYFLNDGEKTRFYSEKKIKETGMLIKEKMVIKENVRGMPF